MTINLKLTEVEAQNLVSLLDAAVRHAGLNAAGIAAAIFEKLQTAPREIDEVPIEEASEAAAE